MDASASPMQLLDLAADQAFSKSLARYTFESQMACQAYCEREIDQGIQENKQLSDESSRALEKQCNKQCTKKFIKSYTMFNNLVVKGGAQTGGQS